MTQKNTKNENLNVADIEVVTSENVTELYRMDAFLNIPGCPDYCVGVAFGDGEVDIFSALAGQPAKFYVEDAVTSGASTEYTPQAALQAILTDMGIEVGDDGSFSVDAGISGQARSLKDFEEGVVANNSDVVDTMEDLLICVSNAYNDLEWS